MCTRYSDRREFLAGMGLSAATLLWSGTLCAADTQAEDRTARGDQPMVRRRNARSRQEAAGHVAG